MVRTKGQALALLRRCGVLTLAPAREMKSLVEAITGERVRGSWWSHPKGKIIYAISTALSQADSVLVTKLVDGKVTFVHRRLWPALVRVITSTTRAREARKKLSARASTLLRVVERDGCVELEMYTNGLAADEKRAIGKARHELEELALVVSASEHTQSGAHHARLRSWSAWMPREVASEVERLPLQEARAQLSEVGIRLSTARG